MGLGCSSLADLETNECLNKFCSAEALSPNDPIWNKLFSHSLRPVFTKDDSFMLDESVENLRNHFMVNNLSTKNFTSLVKVFVLRAIELKSSVQTCDTMFIWQAYNALFIIRNLCKYFVETVGEENFKYQFQAFTGHPENEDVVNGDNTMEESDVLEMLMDSLVKIITELPVKNNTYILHLEAVNTIIILLSIQMYWSKPASKIEPFRVIMQGSPSVLAPLFVRTLLSNYIDQRVPPQSVWHNEEVGSIVIGMASGIWNILRKGVGLGKSKDIMDGLKAHNLAQHSLYLLLILVNHCTNASGVSTPNPYREAIISFGNEADILNEAIVFLRRLSGFEFQNSGDDILTTEAPLFKLNYAKLYDTICAQITTDDTTLLLYMLIHRNNAFKSYIMARSDIELLVLPILKTLYNAPTSTSHHIYMSLIVMLILSEDELFNQQVHDICLKNITWYTERSVSEISLGGLIVLVVIRTIQYNILKMRDKYLHTNCLAALANMSSKFRALHPYVAQRLLSLFETLAKRHAKLLERLAESGNVVDSEQSSETVQDINVLEEVIRMVLEILNSVLTHQLPQNRHLVYTLLYKRKIFDSFRDYSATQDLVYNMDIVITYFSKRLGSEHKDLSVSEVMDRVEDGVLHWSPDIMRKFPDLKFRYVEEEEPEDFFIPYIWSLVYKNSGLYWSPINLSLFSADTDYLV